jgi:hypothetical protein
LYIGFLHHPTFIIPLNNYLYKFYGYMKNIILDMRLLQTHAQAMDNLFRISDLAILFQTEGKNLHDRIRRLVENELLEPVCRGLYGSEGWTLESASARLYAGSFISGPTMLAEYMMIGTIPLHRLFCVKTGQTRVFETPQGAIVYHAAQADKMFGFARQGMVNKADPERALVDTLYYYVHGERYFFDLYSDVRLIDLNHDRFTSYVERYHNPKFKAFAYDYHRARSQAHALRLESP